MKKNKSLKLKDENIKTNKKYTSNDSGGEGGTAGNWGGGATVGTEQNKKSPAPKD